MKKKRIELVILLMLAILFSNAFGLDNGRAKLPPMGWNNYYTTGVYPTQKYIRETADVLVESGLSELGYKIVGIDSNWMKGQRDPNTGDLQYKDDMNVKELSSYIKSFGLVPGLYTDIGPTGCGAPLGSYGNYEKDAEKFLEWGFEFLKIDACGGCPEKHPSVCYKEFCEAIGGRLTINICCWGHYNVNYWGYKYGNTWRSGPDVSALVNYITWQDVIRNIDFNYCPEVQMPGLLTTRIIF